ncbi:MAG TPA: hypothetical protein VK639_04465, partial [Terriglobales bacterium]|nr:hypothetical protein [Terriglobales bacterium]
MNKPLWSLPARAVCACLAGFVLLFSISLKSQTLIPGQPPPAAPEANSTSSTTIRVPGQNSTSSPFLGSIPAGEKTSEILPLSMEEALNRALKYNLGLVLGDQD